jgi:hypothetical protein
VCCASSLAVRVSMREADTFTPSARYLIRACALRLRGVCANCGRLPVQQSSFAHHLVRDCSPRPCAVKARRAESSATPAGRTNPPLVSLTPPVRALLTVAGDELRKDGGNEAGPGLRADPIGKPKGGLRI